MRKDLLCFFILWSAPGYSRPLMLDNVYIVLINPTHPGNIGAAARAMKNMGLRHLRLVRPLRYPSAEATARASGADDVLAAARLYDSLDEAVRDARLVIGTSARPRSLAWPLLNPRECAVLTAAQAVHGPVAVLFGREHSGLTNTELDRCHYMLHIPCSADYSSLNLAAAVQIVTYELRVSIAGTRPPTVGVAAARASAAEMERFYEHLQQTLIEIGFLDPNHPKKLMRRLRRLFNRALPDGQEINILRGILTAVRKPNQPAAQRYKG